MSSNYLAQVANQYEEYPYPERDPEEEKKRLWGPKPDCLDALNYYCFEGGRDFSNGFRVLVAGGGTGDTAIFMAEQLRNFDVEIVHLDISKSSLAVAQKRADTRLLNNIKWMHGSLLDLPALGLGAFDYINCTGVLHHLKSPEEGLHALNSVLNDDGVMALMVYARYGRTAIYQIQELMRRVNYAEDNMEAKVENCRVVLDALPESNWFSHYKRLFASVDFKRPIELYDLFLHSQDRAYTVPELYEFIEHEGLDILHMIPLNTRLGNRVYDPSAYLDNAGLIQKISRLDWKEQQAIAELLNGGIPVHTFYAARNPRPLPDLDNLENIPFISIYFGLESYASLHSMVQNSVDTVTVEDLSKITRIIFEKTLLSEGIFRYMDGNTTLRDIFGRIMKSPKYKKARPTIPALKNEFRKIFAVFNMHDQMFVRKSGVPLPDAVQFMQERMLERLKNSGSGRI